MKKVRVYVNLKQEVLDPQGKAIQNIIHNLGYEDIEDVRAGKFFDIQIDSDNEKHISEEIAVIADKILANPNIEIYKFEIIG
ncbi:MAG: phosphoribosylformylglycinamidine synthase subunit PurS [Candidatus Cloacimonadota bacterium]|nr:phosphoribosylformylglycinamidine synthase subunit PurS [Candidatus Cloacimonadota bacterium]